MQRIQTDIPLNYTTIKTTKSRIDKGLLAIPASLAYKFQQNSGVIYVLDEQNNETKNSFTPYNSSSRECRIGGLKDFYTKFSVKSGDELVVQFLDNGRIRLLPEIYFRNTLLADLADFENTDDEKTVSKKLDKIASFVNMSSNEVLINDFVRLSKTDIPNRDIKHIQQGQKRDGVPASLRKMLLLLYHGKCQLSDFTFITKGGEPYFEIHHIEPNMGNHVKNLLVVSPNIHAQFTYAMIENVFDDEGWLRRVQINKEQHNVNQIIDTISQHNFEKIVHS